MLGYVISEGRGGADKLLETLAEEFVAAGWRLAGAVQVNTETRPGRPCEMHLRVLPCEDRVQISQDLGAMAEGCRLDSEGLEQVVGRVAVSLDAGPELLIVNKFGKQEIAGRGFHPLIGRALADGIPVLCVVTRENIVGFQALAGDLGDPLPTDPDRVRDWCRRQTGRLAG